MRLCGIYVFCNRHGINIDQVTWSGQVLFWRKLVPALLNQVFEKVLAEHYGFTEEELDTNAYSRLMLGHPPLKYLLESVDAILVPATVLGELHARSCYISTMKALIQTSSCGRVPVPLKSDFLSIIALSGLLVALPLYANADGAVQVLIARC